MKSIIERIDMKLTFEDYQNKKFFITPDFKLYKWNKKGKIIDIDAIITTETWNKINDHIKDNFLKEVENKFTEFSQKFERLYNKVPEKEHFLKSEIENVQQIIRGQKNSLFNTPEPCLYLSPSGSILKCDFFGIKEYMAKEYNREKNEWYYIRNIEYNNLSKPYILAEALVKYLSFLKGFKSSLTSVPKKGSISVIRARAFCIALIQESGKRNFLKGEALRRNDIMAFAKKTWGKNGRTVYNECLNILSERNPINKWYKEDNPKEYELGLKLYKEMFPD